MTTGRTPYDSKGRKQGPRGRKPDSAFARRRLRRCCGDRDEQTLRHGDEDGWPPIQGVWKSNATPPGRRGPEPSGCSTEDDGDHRRRLAPLVKRFVLINGCQQIQGSGHPLAWVRAIVLTISSASFWYSGDSDRKYRRI